MRGDTVYLKGEEDIDNNVEDDVVITEEEVDGTNTADEVVQSLSQGAASTRQSSALLRSVVLVVTLSKKLDRISLDSFPGAAESIEISQPN